MCVCAYLFLQYGVFTPTITSHNISLFFFIFFFFTHQVAALTAFLRITPLSLFRFFYCRNSAFHQRTPLRTHELQATK